MDQTPTVSLHHNQMFDACRPDGVMVRDIAIDAGDFGFDFRVGQIAQHCQRLATFINVTQTLCRVDGSVTCYYLRHNTTSISDEGLKTGLGLKTDLKTIFLRSWSWSWPRRSWF